MITVAVGTALYASSEVRHHVGRALDNGVTQTEIAEVITHVSFYYSRLAAEVMSGIVLGGGNRPDELIDGLVFDETGAAKSCTSLATIAVMVSNFSVHLNRGLDNGLSTEEIAELIAQVTLYSGFPTGVNASRTFAEVLRERGLPLPESL